MPPELAPAFLDIILPVMGGFATCLLSLLTWIGHRTYRKLDDICAQLRDGHEKFSDHETRIKCIEVRCAIFHKED